MLHKIKIWFQKWFSKPDYKTMYETKAAEAQHWEFKYNTLSRKLKDLTQDL